MYICNCTTESIYTRIRTENSEWKHGEEDGNRKRGINRNRSLIRTGIDKNEI